MYGEAPLNGRCKFNESLVPDWYGELLWNKPVLPEEWESNVEDVIAFGREWEGAFATVDYEVMRE
ncbi:MAG: hypothetical protein F4W91_00955 [Gemmatimonadetes bacterium]|nr:hypothetical protein [Gemmatimonadota bacterium]